MPKIISVSGNLSQITKLCVNLKSTIHKCNAVTPKAVIGEPLAKFNFGCGRLNWSLETVVNMLIC